MVVIVGRSFGGSAILASTHVLNVSCGVNFQTLQVHNLDSNSGAGNKLESLGFVHTEENTLPAVSGTRTLPPTATRAALFSRPDYAEELQTPIEYSISNPVLFVQLSAAVSGDAGAGWRLVVNDCAALHAENSAEADTRILISKARAVDRGTAIARANARGLVQFRFHQTNNRKALHLRCEAIVCPNEDSSSKCLGAAARWQHTESASRIPTNERIIADPFLYRDDDVPLAEMNTRNFPPPKPTIRCDWTSFTVFAKAIFTSNGEDYAFKMISKSRRNCSSQEAGRNSSSSWLKIPYDGDCNLDSEANINFYFYFTDIIFFINGHHETLSYKIIFIF